MIAATPIFGGHYFVDLFAGIAVAGTVAVFIAFRRPHRGLFASRLAGMGQKPSFVLDDAVLPVGASVMARIVGRRLPRGQKEIA